MWNLLDVTSVPKAALVAAALVSSGPATAETCVSDWSLAAPIVKAQGLVPVEDLSRLSRKKLDGEILTTTLCETGSGYVYRLVVKGKDGKIRSQSVDAKAPFGP